MYLSVNLGSPSWLRLCVMLALSGAGLRWVRFCIRLCCHACLISVGRKMAQRRPKVNPKSANNRSSVGPKSGQRSTESRPKIVQRPAKSQPRVCQKVDPKFINADQSWSNAGQKLDKSGHVYFVQIICPLHQIHHGTIAGPRPWPAPSPHFYRQAPTPTPHF